MIAKTIKECEVCSENKPSSIHPPLTPLVSSYPMEILEVDFFGPMDPDPITGHRYNNFYFIVHLFVYIKIWNGNN